MVKTVYIVDGLRTVIGRPNKSLSGFTAAGLGAAVIGGIIKRNKIDPRKVSEVLLGNVVSAGAGQNVARQAVLLSGMPGTVPAVTVDCVCGSGLEAVILGARAIKSGEYDLCVAGGTESVSNCPRLVFAGHSSADACESLEHDGLTCGLTGLKMGGIAESVVRPFGITREQQDSFTLESHKKYFLAREAGLLEAETAALKTPKGDAIEKDEQPRPRLSMSLLREFSPSFKEGGTLTAANSSTPADGAAALALSSGRGLDYCSAGPLAKIAGYIHVSSAPEQSFLSGVKAARDCLSAAGLAVKDIDLFEIGESFAAQAIMAQRELKIPADKLNVYGGDLALGHPLGAAGARILVTLAHSLKTRNVNRGLACISFGGGGSIAMVIEKCNK